jgi:hypothetical protein
MSNNGIYILANDVVYDQLIALINSIEVNVSPEIPICIIPYNQELSLVSREIEHRPNLSLYDNQESLQRWDKFAEDVWAAHPLAAAKKSKNSLYKSPLLRKLAALDGPFDSFVFYDADSLAMKPLDGVFCKIENYDFVFDDWEHIKPRGVTTVDISLIEESGLYNESQIRPKLHCSSFFASKKGLFSVDQIREIKQLLIEGQEIKWIPRWWDDAFLFTYLTLRCESPIFNYTLSGSAQEKTGNCANADPFVNIDNVLYNKHGLKPIHRLHYMGYSSNAFSRLSRGEDVNIQYKNEFLYYRFLHTPGQGPTQLRPSSLLSRTNRFFAKASQKLALLGLEEA